MDWSVAFALTALIHTPILIAYSVAISSSQLIILYFSITFFVSLAARLFFLKGALIFVESRKFYVRTLPVLVFIALAVIIQGMQWIFNLPPAEIATFYVIGFLLPVNAAITIIFFHLYRTGRCFSEPEHRSIAPLLISVSWAVLFFLDILIWRLIYAEPIGKWTLALLNFDEWYLAVALVYGLMLAGVALFYKHLPHLVFPRERQ